MPILRVRIITGCSEGSVNVIFDDIAKDNWAAGGQLYSDRFPD